MKQSLQLKLGQQLTMTPQLQQAIRLLQLSTLDLQQEIQQALDSNPLLEVSDEESYPSGNGQSDDFSATGDSEVATSKDAQQNDIPEDSADWSPQDLDGSTTMPDDLPVDINWDDLLPSASAPAS